MNSATESLLADIRGLESELLEMVDEPETISYESDLFTPTPQDVFKVIMRDFEEVAAWNPTLSPDQLLDLFGKEAGMRIKCWEEARNLNGRGGPNCHQFQFNDRCRVRFMRSNPRHAVRAI